jgi:hypothetical protein
LYSVTWTGSQLVAVGSFNAIRTSPDGITWTERGSSTFNENLISVTWTGTQLLAVSDFGRSYTSPDGIAWTSHNTIQGEYPRSVAWTGAQFVAVGKFGSILTSPDGSTWTSRGTQSTTQLESVIWTGTQLVAVGNTIATSPDGITWTVINAGVPVSLKCVIASGSRLVAVGGGGTILTATENSSSIKIRPRSRGELSLRLTSSYLFCIPPSRLGNQKTRVSIYSIDGGKEMESWAWAGREIKVPIDRLARGRYVLGLTAAGMGIAEPFEIAR